MWRALQQWYWTRVFHQEIERGRTLELMYQNERDRISAMKALAVRKLNALSTQEATT